MLRVVVVLATVLSAVSTGGRAGADEIAPELETLELRQKAQAETRRLIGALDPKDQRRLNGVDVTFDANANDPSAMVACDDDGDFVIVVTDANAAPRLHRRSTSAGPSRARSVSFVSSCSSSSNAAFT